MPNNFTVFKNHINIESLKALENLSSLSFYLSSGFSQHRVPAEEQIKRFIISCFSYKRQYYGL